MLPVVMVDPCTLWLIDDFDTSEEVEDYISHSLEWMKPNAAGPLKISLSSRAVEALTEAQAFPAEPRLEKALKGAGLEGVISAKTLAASVGRFLANNNWVEDSVGLEGILFNNISIDPDLAESITDPDLKRASKEAVGLTALCTCEINHRHLYAFPRFSKPKTDLDVSFSVDIVDFGSGDIREKQEGSCSIQVLRSPAAWSEAISGEEAWRNAESSEEVEVAILASAMRMDESANCGIKKFRVGSGFLESLRYCGAVGDGAYANAVLQKCAQTVLNISSLQPNHFHNSTSANSTVRVRERDNAIAWRLHVTKRHQALRLMYWELPCGSLEFSTLDEKAEEDILEGEILIARTW